MARPNGLLLALLSLSGACVNTQSAVAQGGDPLTRLRERYPGVQTRRAVGERVRHVFGVPMTAGATPREAAEAFVAEFAPIFGGMDIDIREVWSRNPGRGKSYFAYQQFIDGLPVFGSCARVMVVYEPSPRVASVAAKVAPHPSTPLPPTLLTPSQAIEAAMGHPRARGLTTWGEPTQSVWCGEAWGLNTIVGRVWLCRGRSGDENRQLLFVVHGRTAEVLAILNETMHFSHDETITGTVDGRVLAGLTPYWGTAPTCEATSSVQPLERVLIQVIRQSNEQLFSDTFSDADGEFSLAAPTGQLVIVRATLMHSHWRVRNCLGQAQHACSTGPTWSVEVRDITGPEEVELHFVPNANEPTREHEIAQTNARHVLNTLDGYCASFGLLPDAPYPIDVNVNADNDTCSPVFGNDENFFIHLNKRASTCPNNAFTTIMAHEYGHYICAVVLGLGTGGFGQGYADSLAQMVYDTTIIGANFEGCNNHSRDNANPGESYPSCSSGDTGELLAGIWADIRENLGASGLGEARTLHADWSLMTVGEDGPGTTCNPQLHPECAGPGTFMEVLLADDNDANLNNGTPHDTEICSAFCENGVPAPESGICVGSTCPESPVPGLCSIDCDFASGRGVLDAEDFSCFMQRFQKNDPWACNFDLGSGWDVCDVFDFLSYQRLFAEGCH